MGKKGYLVLEDGQHFEGNSFGSVEGISGEVVFNTGMVGYPEGFTDPSYYGQILVMTYPLIGNYGVPPKTYNGNILQNWESENIQIRGLIVSQYMDESFHWQSASTLSSWLRREKVPALGGIDTRTLTKIIRENGVMKGIITFEKPRNSSGFNFVDINKLNLVDSVSTSGKITYGNGRLKILFIDCGMKANQIRLMLKYDTTVVRVPWDYDVFRHERLEKYDGIFISNGPGDPKMADVTVSNIKKAFSFGIPIFGICLGNQILALSAGGDTYKLKYGHRGQNQPVRNLSDNRCYVTTQNHGFAVRDASLPTDWKPWFINLNDETNEGIKHVKLPFFSVQFHPEAAPGPADTEWLFGFFINQIKIWRKIR